LQIVGKHRNIVMVMMSERDFSILMFVFDG